MRATAADGGPESLTTSGRNTMHTRALVYAGFLLTIVVAPVAAQVRAEYGLTIPMRDGVRLAADMWRPEAPGRYPVLLVRTPYLKTVLRLSEWARWFASRGYVFVVQDTRGRGDSEGSFEFFAGDGKDGYDSIEWRRRSHGPTVGSGPSASRISARCNGSRRASIPHISSAWRRLRLAGAGSRRSRTSAAPSRTSG